MSIMNRESLKRHCEATCKKFKDVPTSGTYGEHRLVLDLLEQTTWIPCSERLPQTDGVYIVTRRLFDKQIDTEPYYMVDACYFDGSNTWHDDNRINYSRPFSEDIIAWMPLPEPYKGE